MSAHTQATLTALLPSSPYLLAYALPLLSLSLLLTFAGAFLTLDRTRVFAPRYDALSPPETTKIQHAEAAVKRVLRLEGGIGGAAIGFVTGVHFTTFLSLLIPNTTSDAPLKLGAFVAVWLLSGIIFAALAARWKYAALAFAGLSGYSTLALALAVIVHPSLLTRHVFVAVFTPIGLILCLLPIARTQHVFVRVGMASAGSFGTILAISLLAHLSAWGDVWSRLWIHDGSEWGTPKEKALSAAFCLFLVVGSASDWFLKVKLGENPDEKWDSYLAEYAATLPNARDRAGTFRPLQSFWTRHFGHGTDPIDKDIIFPADLFTPHPELLRKDRKPVLSRGRTREIIKFDPHDPYTLSDSDDEDDLMKIAPTFLRAPTRTDSMATLTNEKPSPAKGAPDGRRAKVDPLSDGEEDVTSGASRERTTSPTGDNWSPGFIRRHSQRPLAHRQSTAAFSQAASSSNGSGSSATLAPAAFTPVPATPSLIKAVERVNAAQQEAFANQAARSTDGLPIPSAGAEQAPYQGPPHGRHWDAFWRDVKTKAGHGFHHRRDGGDGARAAAAGPTR
ncbi:hypothetical protein C2E23DRAFT_839591 [Lenzites betulinus]|nr:hypothetical protein C2E23DRAFT_839591 [Lenzites betulinus]